MSYECRVVDSKPQPALVVRKRSSVQDLQKILGPAWGAIMEYAGRNGAQPAGPYFVAYHNRDMQDLDLEIGIPISRPLSGEGEIHQAETPGGRTAECVHIGPYDKIGAAYDALQKWMHANGYTPSGVAWEFYLNDPHVTPEAEIQTRIAFPLK
jgi:effector-binding domain-containing protein